MKKIFKKIQYNYYISNILYFILRPIIHVSSRLSNQIKRKVKINGKVIQYFNHKIKFPKNVGINFSSQVFWNGSNQVEPNTVKCISILLKGGDIFLDIGSNFGIYALIAKRINPEIQVFAFEPLPNLQVDNKLFLKLNGITNYELIKYAISDTDGEADFYVPDSYISASEISSSSLQSDFHFNNKFIQRKIKVPTMTLNKFMYQNKVLLNDKKIILKIDIEGHEATALRGGREFLKVFRPLIVMEVDQTTERLMPLILELEESNYSIYSISKEGFFKLQHELLAEYTGDRDFLLLPSELLGIKDYMSFSNLDILLKRIEKNCYEYFNLL
jgi:FkbM family methyltransferase